jgi:hypothetical protein
MNSTLKMQKVCSSETLVLVNQTKGHHMLLLIIKDVFLADAP